VLTNKNTGVTITQTNVSSFDSQHVSAQTGHHLVILDEYTNDEGLHIYCNDTINLLIEIGSDLI
jgi:hypothetical protein